MSFRLTNTPKVFMDLFVNIFNNDILFYSKIEADDIYQTFEDCASAVREEKLYSKFSKCEFWLSLVTFLGHVVSKEGIRVDPTKIEVV